MAKKTKNEEVETKSAKSDTKKSKPVKVEKAVEEKIVPRLSEKYLKDIVPAMMKQFSYKNINEVPKLEKIVVNIGVGEAVQDSKLLDEAVKDLETITGQKSSVRTARQSISNFKLREGMKIGTKVTLRRQQMYEFLDRLVAVALPRVRDFRGIPDKSFDGRGNYTLGIKEHIIFPEINVDKVNRVLGMDVTFVTTAKTDKESFELLSAFGLPFKKKEIN
ncbi:MAG: 50S ribosomal protein L5 [Melioribacteraceae bacterium]|nr:50S ribosomal protein L5 [Melioribacteraceae bacterium]